MLEHSDKVLSLMSQVDAFTKQLISPREFDFAA